MTPSPDDAARWRAHYAHSAGAWTRWADTLAEQQAKVNALLLDAAGVAPGQRVLDLASGAGEPALSVQSKPATTACTSSSQRRLASASAKLASNPFRANVSACPASSARASNVRRKFAPT
jgi:cyclopropane fatty-acyl-phospholipid synthase-like methyltransferase